MTQFSVAERHVIAALELVRRGEFLDALTEGEKAVKEDENLATAYLVIGISAYGLSDQGSALTLVEKAHQLDPDCREIAEVLSSLYSGVGKLNDSVYFAKLALALQPHPRISGLIPAFIASPMEALMTPGLSLHYLNAATAFAKGQIDTAIAGAESELRINPTDVDSMLLLARALMAKGEVTPALAHLHAAVHLKPQMPWLHANMGDCLLTLGRHAEAAACHRRALQLAPAKSDEVKAHALAGLAKQSNAAIEGYDAARATWTSEISQRRKPPQNSKVNIRSLKGDLILGWLGDSFHDSPNMQMLLPAMSHGTNHLVNITYNNSPLNDQHSRRLKASVMRWHDVVAMDDWSIARVMAGDEIDVLIDTTNLGTCARANLRGAKAAPLVVKWLGLPFDAEGADLVLSGPMTIAADRLSGIECVEMKTLFPFEFLTPMGGMPDIAPLQAADLGFVTFGGVFDLTRLTPTTAALWADVLHATPNSRLMLGYTGATDPNVRRTALDLFAHQGVAHRVEAQQIVDGIERKVDFFNMIDILLDSTPHGVSAEACEALWMGVPVVTLAGQSRSGLMAASALHAAGLPEWISKTSDEFVGIAKALAHDIPTLAAIRSGLRTKVIESPLCDSKTFFADMTELLRYCLASRYGQ